MENKKVLFVSTSGQSRSVYFAERFMEKGIKCIFCGYDKYSDIKVNSNLIRWSNIVILLDKNIKFDTWYEQIKILCQGNRQLIEYFIEDEEIFFDLKFSEFIETLGL